MPRTHWSDCNDCHTATWCQYFGRCLSETCPDGLTDFRIAAKAASPGSRETVEDRAIRLLRDLLPSFASRDDAIQHLYYVQPGATMNTRIYSIAAALYVLGNVERHE